MINSTMKLFIFTFIILCSSAFCEDKKSTISKIDDLEFTFLQSSKKFEIDINTLKSIVYVERSQNFDWFDKALDVLTALKGYNSSIGFCQVKMKTAYWIEVQLSYSTSEFYPGKHYQDILPISKSPREIIKKLQNDSLNILYAAAYVKIIQSYWQRAGYPINDRPDILGTLYSTGFYKSTGEIRKPNANPKANRFGKKTLEAYNLFSNKKIN